jgi:hypothetical protein
MNPGSCVVFAFVDITKSDLESMADVRTPVACSPPPRDRLASAVAASMLHPAKATNKIRYRGMFVWSKNEKFAN